MDTEVHGAFTLLKPEAQGVGSSRSFPAQSDSTLKMYSCALGSTVRTSLWARFSGILDHYGVRGAAGGLQAAAAKPLVY